MEGLRCHNNKSAPLVVFIEGNIGAGKSTLLRGLAERYSPNDCVTMTEPISKWKSLELFYKNREMYAFPLQSEVVQSFLERDKTICNTKKLYIFERSLRSCKLFSKMNCTEAEVQLLQEYLWNNDTRPPPPNYKFIYLRTPADQCLEHIKHRQKPTDCYIDLEYLKKLEIYHDKEFTENNSLAVVDTTHLGPLEVINEIVEILDAALED